MKKHKKTFKTAFNPWFIKSVAKEILQATLNGKSITQEIIARELGVSQGQFSRWRKKEVPGKVVFYVRLASRYKVDSVWLMRMAKRPDLIKELNDITGP